MSEVTANAAASAQATATKKVKRGVSNATQAVASLKFNEKDASRANNLFVGQLKEVTVEYSTNADNKDFPSMAVPRISLHFCSNHQNAAEVRHYYHNIFPVPSNVNTIPGASEEWKVNNVFAWIKHVLDVFYLRGRELNDAEVDALALPFDDTDDDGNYSPVDAEDVLAGYRVVFDNAVAMLNGAFGLEEGKVAKACYKDAAGAGLPIWMKLLRHKKRKNEWINVGQNGDLAFDGFIGNGCIELLVKDKPASILRVDLSKESITPKETKKVPTVGAGFAGAMDAMAGMPAMPGMPMDEGNGMDAFDGNFPY